MLAEVLLYSFIPLILLVGFYNFAWKRRKLPPGPCPLPLIGNKLSMRGSNQTVESLLRWKEKYGPVYTYWMGECPVAAITDFQLMREVFSTSKLAETCAGRDFFTSAYEIAHGGVRGVVGTEGEEWRVMRRLTLQMLRQLGMGKSAMEEMIMVELEALHESICSELNSDGVVEECNLIALVELAIGSILNQTVFGYRFHGPTAGEFYRLKHILDAHMHAFDSLVIRTVLTMPWLRHIPIPFGRAFDEFRARIDTIYTFLDSQIQAAVERRNSGESEEPTCLVDAFVKAAVDEKDGNYINLNSLRSLCWDLFSAGQETTSNTLNFLILYLLRYPEVQKRMQAELDSLNISTIKCEHRLQLPFTQAVINESQRLCNLLVENLNHRTMADVVVGEHYLPAHTLIVPQISCALHDPNVFPNPTQFRPERFLDEKTGLLKRVDEFIPFSLGKRQCVGESMAKMELFLFTSNLFKTFEIRASDEATPPSLEPQSGLTSSPALYNCRLIQRGK